MIDLTSCETQKNNNGSIFRAALEGGGGEDGWSDGGHAALSVDPHFNTN